MCCSAKAFRRAPKRPGWLKDEKSAGNDPNGPESPVVLTSVESVATAAAPVCGAGKKKLAPRSACPPCPRCARGGSGVRPRRRRRRPPRPAPPACAPNRRDDETTCGEEMRRLFVDACCKRCSTRRVAAAAGGGAARSLRKLEAYRCQSHSVRVIVIFVTNSCGSRNSYYCVR